MRRLIAALATMALVLSPMAARPARADVLHDFDATTLTSYLALRFSSGVPAAVMEKVLAGEGFSQTDLALVVASNSSVGRPSSDQGTAGLSSSQQISQDSLACPATDRSCELDTEPEPDIAVNPDAPGNLVGVFQMGRFPNGGAVDVGFATSFDGGNTWPYKGSAPGLTVGVAARNSAGPGAPFARASDAAVAYDRKHKNVYLNWIAVSDAGCAIFCDTAVGVNVSNNQGQTFGPPIVLHEDDQSMSGPTFVFNDKNWIGTDNTATSPFYGRTYAVWDQVRCAESSCSVTSEPVVLRYSDDGGKSWSRLIDATSEQPGLVHSEVGAQPLTMPNGDVVIVYADIVAGAYTYAGSYKAVRSTDGGNTWSSPVLIATTTPYLEEANGFRAPNIQNAATDGAGAIYVAFQDGLGSPGRNNIWLTHSMSPDGTSWAFPTNVTAADAATLDHFTPAIAVVGTTVHLTYRTRPTGPITTANHYVDAVYRRVSGGVAGSPISLNATLTNLDLAAFTTLAGQQLKFLGDYAGIAASSISAHPIWSQAQNFAGAQRNPTNTHQRTFSARLQ